MSSPTPPPQVPTCPHGRECGGCAWIDRPYPAQLLAKESRVAAAAQRFEELASAPRQPVVGAPRVLGYRVRAKLVVAPPSSIGLYARASHSVIDIPGCLVLAPELKETLAKLRELLPLRVPLLAVDLQLADGGVFLTLIVPHGTSAHELAAEAEALSARIPSLRSVAASFRARDSVQVLGTELKVLNGPTEMPRRFSPTSPFHYVSHGAFSQVNLEQAAAIYGFVQKSLADGLAGDLQGAQILDLFAGSGALGLQLAQRGATVTCVEVLKSASDRAAAAAKAQDLKITALTGDAEAVLESLFAAGARFDAVVVNPPRYGLGAKLRNTLGALWPEQIAYISCGPESLARDLAHLTRLGYRASLIQPFDMMPLTDQVECVALLSRCAPPPPTILHEDARLLAVAKPPHLPTTPQVGHSRSLLGEVQKLQGWETATPLQDLRADISGVCLFARRSEFLAELGAALASGVSQFIALVRGIARAGGTISRSLKATSKPGDARTRYRRASVVSSHSLVRITPSDASGSQICRHFANIGHPVLGDEHHGDPRSNLHFSRKHNLDRAFLHCKSITLQLEGKELLLEVRLSPDLGCILESLAERADSAPQPTKALLD